MNVSSRNGLVTSVHTRPCSNTVDGVRPRTCAIVRARRLVAISQTSETASSRPATISAPRVIRSWLRWGRRDDAHEQTLARRNGNARRFRAGARDSKRAYWPVIGIEIGAEVRDHVLAADASCWSAVGAVPTAPSTCSVDETVYVATGCRR